MSRVTDTDWILYGSELSPFSLKTRLLLQNAGLPFRFLPDAGNFRENLRTQIRLRGLISGRLPLTWPEMTYEDEFPLVPYLFGPNGENLYDSTAIAAWLDMHAAPPTPMLPADPALAMAIRLVDDYADEFGLYLVHHQRWVVSATDNTAGRRLAHEWRSLLGPLQRPFGAWFSARQVRRLPYLFSVSEAGTPWPGLPRWRQPPSRPGFPGTHRLLEAAFLRLVDALETILSRRSYLFGNAITLADTAIFGMLAINLDDPSANRHIRQRAPQLHDWLLRLRRGDLGNPGGAIELDDSAAPLLNEICRTQLPLMQQNLAACTQWQQRGAKLYGEAAFRKNRALYEGQLDSQRFRHVAKPFQARVWRQWHADWCALPTAEQQRLRRLLDQPQCLDAARIEVQLL